MKRPVGVILAERPMCVPRILHGAQAKRPSLRRSPVALTRASGNTFQSLRAWATSERTPCSGSGVSGSS